MTPETKQYAKETLARAERAIKLADDSKKKGKFAREITYYSSEVAFRMPIVKNNVDAAIVTYHANILRNDTVTLRGYLALDAEETI